jgi:hypothetical protein
VDDAARVEQLEAEVRLLREQREADRAEIGRRDRALDEVREQLRSTPLGSGAPQTHSSTGSTATSSASSPTVVRSRSLSIGRQRGH